MKKKNSSFRNVGSGIPKRRSLSFRLRICQYHTNTAELLRCHVSKHDLSIVYEDNYHCHAIGKEMRNEKKILLKLTSSLTKENVLFQRIFAGRYDCFLTRIKCEELMEAFPSLWKFSPENFSLRWSSEIQNLFERKAFLMRIFSECSLLSAFRI